MLSLQVLLFVIVTFSTREAFGRTPVKREVSTSSSSFSSGGGGTYTSGFAASTGSDGKTYYVKEVNGKVERGVMEGPMPMPDLSSVYATAFAPFRYNNFPFAYPYGVMDPWALNNAIRQSVNSYMQRFGI